MRRCKFGRRSDGKCRKTPASHGAGLGRPAKRKRKLKRQPATGREQFCVMGRTPEGESASRCFTTSGAALDYATSSAGNRALMLYRRKKVGRGR